VPETQGLSTIAFFEATAFIILLVLFVLLRKDHPSRFLNIWLAGWCLLTIRAFLELAQSSVAIPQFRVPSVVLLVAVSLIFLQAVFRYVYGARYTLVHLWPAFGAVLLIIGYFESRPFSGTPRLRWFSSAVLAAASLIAGWNLWRVKFRSSRHGARLLGGLFLLSGLHGLDRSVWADNPFHLQRVAFDNLLAVALGIAMVVVVLEGARARTEELNDKLNRLSLLIAASTQTLSVREMLDQVLVNVVGSLGVSDRKSTRLNSSHRL